MKTAGIFAAIVSLLFLASVSFADVMPPSLPSIFSGNVMLNGQPAPIGAIIDAKIGGALRGTITTEVSGLYGSDRKLLVTGTASYDDGATIDFYVNGIKASQSGIWNEGAVYALNLDATAQMQTSGGGGGGSPAPKEVPKNETSFIESGLLSINFKTPVLASIAELSSKPKDIPSPANAVYKYIEINVSKETGGIIEFKVEKSWIAANMIETVVLSRYSANSWSELATSRIKEDSTYAYFIAETEGFSVFAITGKKAAKETCPKERTIAYNPENLECIEYPSKCDVPKNMIIADKCPQVVKSTVPAITGNVLGSGSKSAIYIFIILVVLCVVFFYTRKTKKPAKRKR